MKRYALLLCALMLVITGCSRHDSRASQVLAKVNNYEITTAEFDREFNASAYRMTPTIEAKKEFLQTLIDRKLVLQDAQARGIDRDKSFLEAIQRFWEQALVKLAVERKVKEIAAAMPDTPLSRKAEQQALHDWLKELGKRATIQINDALLADN